MDAGPCGRRGEMERLQSWDNAVAGEIIAQHREAPGALLPMLHALQEAFGYIAPEAVPLVAEALNISQAEVHGVISFYRDFRTAPPGRHMLEICRAEACQSMGCDSLIGHVRRRLKVELGQTTADGAFTVREVFCLGNCALSPAAMLDGKLYGRVSPATADRLIDAAKART